MQKGSQSGNQEAYASRIRNSRSPPKVPFDPKKGDIIVTNSSSYIDLLFLVFRCAVLLSELGQSATELNSRRELRRYNATLTLPVTSGPASSATAQIIGWRRVSLLRALFASGTLPQPATTAESLTQLVASADGPVVIFPEVGPVSRRRLGPRAGTDDPFRVQCTTSNNRAVLKFGDFAPSAAAGEVKSARIFVLAFR